MTGPRAWTLELPPGLATISLNQDLHWAQRCERKRLIGDAALVLARKQRIPRMDRIEVEVVYRPPDRRKRDEDNLAPTAKAAIDGIKKAGVVVDDCHEHVRFDGVRIGAVYPLGRIIVRITEAAA